MGIARHALLPSAFAVTLLLSACGGGGGGGTTTPSVTLVPAGQINLALADGFVSPSGVLGGTEGTGLWDGGGGSSDSGGSADAGGSAGDGEFVKVSIKFPGNTGNGTLKWTILRSAYGLENTSGPTLDLQPDTSGAGGYKVVGGGTNQSNIFVSKSGQISGSLPLPISSGPNSVFVGTRFNDSTATTLATYAGTYNYVAVSATKGTGTLAQVDSGIVFFANDGKGRICPNQNGVLAYSPTCAEGLDIVGKFDSTANNVLRFVQSPTQATANAITNNNQMDMIAVAKSFSSPSLSQGMTFSGDFINYNKTDGYRTGAVYATRQGNASGSVLSTFAPANLLNAGAPGYWNLTVKDVSNPSSGQGKIVYAMFKDVGGGVVKRSFWDTSKTPGSECSNSNDSNGFVANAPGTVRATISNGATTFNLGIAQSDADSFIFGSSTSMGVGRKTNSPTVSALFANCQPV